MRDSFQGYCVKLKMRSKRTLLTEGSSDKKILDRIICEKQSTTDLLVDTVELVDSPAGNPLSNRAKVEALHIAFTGPRTKVAAFVDREYRAYSGSGFSMLDTTPGHNTTDSTCFWTLGHSIENYFFFSDFFDAYLKEIFPEAYNTTSINRLQRSFDSICLCAASLSLSAYENQVIDRISGFFKKDYFGFDVNGNCEIDYSAIELNLVTARGMLPQTAHDFTMRSKALRASPPSPPTEFARKLCHGHIALNVIRSAITSLLKDLIPNERSDEMERADNNGLMRKFAHHLCISRRSHEWFPSTLYQWI